MSRRRWKLQLSNLRAYYSAVVSTDNYQTLCQKTVPPYSEYTLVRDMQTAMRGGNLVDKYVEGYTYINLRNGWDFKQRRHVPAG